MNIIPFNYESKEIRTIVDENGEPWWVAADVCSTLGLSNPTMAIDSLDEDERSKFYLGRQGETNIINEPGLYTLVIRSNKPEAKKFKRWITHDVLPSIRKTGSYSMRPTEQFEMGHISLKYLRSELRMNDSSYLGLVHTLHEHHGLSTAALPQYTKQERISKAAKDLLKEIGSDMTTRRLNPLLEKAGILEPRERTGKGGAIKKFKALTEEGLKYGENLVNPRSPKQSQPHYYTDTFREVVKIAKQQTA